MITTSDQFIIEDSSKVLYDGLSLVSIPTVLDEQDLVSVDVRVVTDSGAQVSGIIVSFTNAEIAAFTPSGTTDRDKFFNQVEQAVKGYLEAFGGNAGVTFTIA